MVDIKDWEIALKEAEENKKHGVVVFEEHKNFGKKIVEEAESRIAEAHKRGIAIFTDSHMEVKQERP